MKITKVGSGGTHGIPHFNPQMHSPGAQMKTSVGAHVSHRLCRKRQWILRWVVFSIIFSRLFFCTQVTKNMLGRPCLPGPPCPDPIGESVEFLMMGCALRTCGIKYILLGVGPAIMAMWTPSCPHFSLPWGDFCANSRELAGCRSRNPPPSHPRVGRDVPAPAVTAVACAF